ncbi:diguanylate cyclase [Paucibacter sp. R3-3]|uniref:diguanylate cyclase n=1 Tax=Roseateles agri TaxID=3098619 RepID=A0ABU5DJ33_9BURK|nr:diguanylate cyclase [Paucibacter sp. R3-3]MDY0746297.1 diguanylate cyclase [Paucibacter sp. R3-3]
MAEFTAGVWRRLRLALLALLALLGLMLGPATQAQILRLDQLAAGPMGARALYLQEQRGTPPLTLAQARAALLRGEFHRDERPIASFGLSARPVWIYLELQNPLDDDVAVRLLAGMAWVDHLDVAQIKGGQVLASWNSGDEGGRVDGAGNLLPGLGYAFPLSVPAGRSEIFIRAQTPDPLVVPVSLELASEAGAEERAVHYGYGLLYGFLLALIAYNAMVFAGLRTGSYLHYAFYLLSFIALNLAYTGHGFAWWWPGDAYFQRYVIFVMMVVFGAAGFIFAEHFLDLRRHARRLRLALIGTSLAALLAVSACALVDWQAAAGWIAFVFLFAFGLVMVLLGVWAWRRRQPAAPYFLAAVLCGMGGTLVTTLAVWGLLPMSGPTFHGIEIGVTLEAVLLALALANHLRSQERARHQAELQARTDALTGLSNRRAFYERARGLWATAVRRGRPLCIVMLDIDHFKDFNDRHGHDGGDRVLVMVAEVLRSNCRAGDLAVRWGGEEFLLLLPETDLSAGLAFAERLRAAVEGSAITLGGDQRVFLSVSLGVAPLELPVAVDATLETLIATADQFLYRAKNEGRNRVAGP